MLCRRLFFGKETSSCLIEGIHRVLVVQLLAIPKAFEMVMLTEAG